MRKTRPRATGAREAPPARLIHQHRHSLTNALILGGSSLDRTEWALAFHRESPLRLGTLVRLDCSRDESRLQSALRDWSTGVATADTTLIAAQHGTLFLDSIDDLSLESQRLLLPLATVPPAERGRTEMPSIGRLICGSTARLVSECTEGRFLLQLYDALDKIRIDLDRPAEGAA
jgi:DNA-binding NtrC family response regulator